MSRLPSTRIFLATVRPRVLPTPRTSARAFSLWGTSAASPPDLQPPIDTLSALLEAPPDLTTAAIEHTPTILEPLSAVFLSLPPSLGISFALFLPLATILLRCTTTLPITLWQRARTRKFTDVVMPLIRQAQAAATLAVRSESRRAGKTYEEYQVAYKARAEAEAAKIIKAHHANPRLTLYAPPLLHLPIFILTTLVIRDASQRSLASIALIPSSPSATLSYSDLALSHLHELAATPFLWCPSMVLPDPYLFLPLAVGLAAMANVEVSAANRRRTTADALATADARAEEWTRRVQQEPVKPLSVEARRRMAIQMAKQKGSRGFAVMATPPRPSPWSKAAKAAGARGPPVEETVELEIEDPTETRTTRIWTNAMRVAAVAFIPIASMSPSSVCAYWLASNMFTLVQNSIFALIDRRREVLTVAARRAALK